MPLDGTFLCVSQLLNSANMNSALKMLQALICTVALFILALAGVALSWPDVPLAQRLGCFDSYSSFDKFLLLPIQSQPFFFAIGSSAVIAVALLSASVGAWRNGVERRNHPA